MFAQDVSGVKRRRVGYARNPFIDDHAIEDEEEYEEEEYEDENEEGDPRLDEDSGHHRERLVMGHETSREWHTNALAIAEKYKNAAARMGRVPETSMLGVNYDVPLWRVIVPMGKEAVIVSEIRPKVSAVFECSRVIPGSVYVEAGSAREVLDAIKGCAQVFGINTNQTIQFIPADERTSLLNLGRSSDLDSWARVCGRGKYRNDLAHILSIDLATTMATVLLVPRLSYPEPEDGLKGKRKKKVRRRNPPRIFDFQKVAPNLEQLDNGRIKYKGEVYFNGLIEVSLPLVKLEAACPPPSAAELTNTITTSAMARAWSEFAATNLVPGNPIQVTSGEQKGLIGKVLEIVNGTAKCVSEKPEILTMVPVTSLRLYLCVGDYVQVCVGTNVGKFGGVINVEWGVDTDVVTFTDDDSFRTGRPEQITLSVYLVKMYDRPVESGFFPHSSISKEESSGHRNVLVVGKHADSGRRGVVCGVGDFNNGGVGSYIVEMQPEKQKKAIPAECLVTCNPIKVGSHISITNGGHAGKFGRVISIENESLTFMEDIGPRTCNVAITIGISQAVALVASPEFEGTKLFHKTRSNRNKDSGVGLKVTVSGKHPFSGYHGIVCEAVDQLTLPHFMVELEATSKKQTISAHNLIYRRGERHNQLADKLFLGHTSGSAEPSTSRRIFAPSMPLVPSTPLPSEVISGGSPAWDPSSRMPGRPFESDDPPIRPHLLIPKPAGKLNRTNGYNLEDTLKLDGNLYSEINAYISKLASEHFDLDLPLTKQSSKARDVVFDEATKKISLLKKYKDNWVAKDFLSLFLKTANQRNKRHAAAQ